MFSLLKITKKLKHWIKYRMTVQTYKQWKFFFFLLCWLFCCCYSCCIYCFCYFCLVFFLLLFIRPLIDKNNQEKKWPKISISPSVFAISVCLSVCAPSTGHSFCRRQLIFDMRDSWVKSSKRNFFVFGNFEIWPTYGYF